MQDNECRVKCRRWLIGAAILIIAIAVVGLIGLNYTRQTPAKSVVKITDFSESRLKRSVERNSGVGISGLKIDEQSGLVTVFYLDDDARDENTIIFDLSIAGARIMPSLFKINGVRAVKVVGVGTFIDSAGNSSVDQSAAITISKNKAAKIDWAKVNETNNAGLISEATELSINPTIRDGIDNLDVLNAIIAQLSSKHE